MKGKGRLLARAGEDGQVLAVDVVVGEGYEPPVPASVVPFQHLLLDGKGLDHVQDGLDVGC